MIVTLSRETRLVMALLILSFAAWLWSNVLITGRELRLSNLQLTNAPSGLPEPLLAPPNGENGLTLELIPTEGGIAIIIPPEGVSVGTPLVAREVTIFELPFLVTTPLVVPTAPGEAPAVEAVVPGGQIVQRSSVNPFSPLLVTPPPAVAAPPPPAPVPAVTVPVPVRPTTPPPPATAPATAPATVEVTPVVPVPAAPVPVPAAPVDANGNVVRVLPPEPIVPAPAPTALTPPAPRVTALPRALPNGTLPAAPEILRTVRTEPAQAVVVAPTPVNVAQRAAVRLPPRPAAVAPGSVLAARPAPAAPVPDPQPALGAIEAVALTPLTSPRQRPPVAPAPAPVVAPAAEPDIVGLARYVRDNDLIFTGAVLGPVSVGVFRSAQTNAPFVVTLGQRIPNTDIVLTDVQSQQAVITRNNDTQVLTLSRR